MSQEDGSYFDVPFCRIGEDIYPLSNLAESERENLTAQKSDSSKLIVSPGIVLQGKVNSTVLAQLFLLNSTVCFKKQPFMHVSV